MENYTYEKHPDSYKTGKRKNNKTIKNKNEIKEKLINKIIIYPGGLNINETDSGISTVIKDIFTQIGKKVN